MKNEKESSSEEEREEEIHESKPKEKKEKKLLNKKRKDLEKDKDKEEEDDKKNDDIIVGESEVKFILDRKRRITVHKFKRQIKVDIREFYDDNGVMKPGKKGISLSLENWKKLKGFLDDIDESIDNLK